MAYDAPEGDNFLSVAHKEIPVDADPTHDTVRCQLCATAVPRDVALRSYAARDGQVRLCVDRPGLWAGISVCPECASFIGRSVHGSVEETEAARELRILAGLYEAGR